jgi:diaminopimelate epimerase
VKITKMQGIGNDFVMVDAIDENPISADLGETATFVCDRRRGVGADGLIIVERGQEAPFKMRMFNPDGSESEMCGNGIRCVSVLLRDLGRVEGGHVTVETLAGLLDTELLDADHVRVDMGPARLKPSEIGMKADGDQFLQQNVGGGFVGTAVSMGNPHLVILVEDVDGVDLDRLGPIFETHPFFPDRTNVHFVQVIDRQHLKTRTWERGAGITLACGTGACASAVAAFLAGRSDRAVEVQLPGGKLQVEYLESGHVLMTGPAKTIFTATIDIPSFG